MKKEKQKKPLGREILSWVLTLLSAVVIAMAIRTFIFQPVRVDGSSGPGRTQRPRRTPPASPWAAIRNGSTW